jgi:hypothetical protein
MLKFRLDAGVEEGNLAHGIERNEKTLAARVKLKCLP